jgi:hypothetical protein
MASGSNEKALFEDGASAPRSGQGHASSAIPAAGPAPAPAEHARSRVRRAGPLRIALRALLACSIVALLFFLDQLRRDVEAADFTLVETDRARLDGAGWVDPRWTDEVARRVAQLPDFSCDDRAAIERVANEVAALPFVAEVYQPEVLWPDGLRLPVRLRVPVACVRVGRQFLPVCEDGTVLSGAWPSPPGRGAGILPVIALEREDERHVRPGSVLWSAAAQDGLSVAISLWQRLASAPIQRLGRIVIDARDARRASVEEPGTVLLLEHGRRVLFGRAADTCEPGELPAEQKWALIARALELLPPLAEDEAGTGEPSREGDVDWELFDARWDRGEILPRAGATGEDREARGGR